METTFYIMAIVLFGWIIAIALMLAEYESDKR